MGIFRQDEIGFNILNKFKYNESKHVIKGKLTSNKNDYSNNTENNNSFLANGVDIDWNNSGLSNNVNLNTTGEFLSFINDLCNRIHNVKTKCESIFDNKRKELYIKKNVNNLIAKNGLNENVNVNWSSSNSNIICNPSTNSYFTNLSISNKILGSYSIVLQNNKTAYYIGEPLQYTVKWKGTEYTEVSTITAKNSYNIEASINHGITSIGKINNNNHPIVNNTHFNFSDTNTYYDSYTFEQHTLIVPNNGSANLELSISINNTNQEISRNVQLYNKSILIIPYNAQYLRLTALENNTTFKFTNPISYSLDYGSTWTSLAANTNTPSLNANTDILFKGTLTPTSINGIGTFSSNNKTFNVSGNIMSLLYGDNFKSKTSLSGKDYAFYNLFNNSKVVDASNLILPATTLSEACYYYMFSGCISLTSAPALTATTLTPYCYQGMFSGCARLTSAPVLPATILATQCYTNMFERCTALTTAPVLPATTLAENCYYKMFCDCTNLTSAPVLPATTLADGCYVDMFSSCKSITSAPVLPATTLAESCYSSMFYGCTGLTSAPALPATTLDPYCYSSMFSRCTNLTSPPAILPAKNLVNGCYNSMFNECTSLTTAPILPAALLASNCYSYMFYCCSSLNYIKALFTTTPDTSCTKNWVYGVARSGLFIKSSNATWDVTGVNGIPTSWRIDTQEFTLTALENNTTFKFTNEINYSLNYGVTWTSLAANTNTPTLNANTDILFKGMLAPTSSNGIGTFSSNNKTFNASGNVASLIYSNYIIINKISLYDKHYLFRNLFADSKIVNASNLILQAEVLSLYCYAYMFEGCTKLNAAPVLPATELANYCYYKMFNGCTSLTTAPALPATTLVESCYDSMFYGCTSLRSTPVLPATTLAAGCYSSMFANCTNLTSAPALQAATLANSCYSYMFMGCTSLTTAPALPATTLVLNCYRQMFDRCTSLTTAPALPATTLANSCYLSMFADCTNLTSAPALPATTLANYCYSEMFSGCTSLTTAPALPATTLATSCYRRMFKGCINLTTAPSLSATTLVESCYDSMFYGCTSLTTAPALPATTLVYYCYNYMFYNCSSLNYIKALFTTTPSTTYTTNWVYDVANSGTFVKNFKATWNIRGVHSIPENWTVEYNEIIWKDQYLTLIALENNTTFKFTNIINYSLDYGATWISLAANTNTPSLNANTNILFKGTLTPTNNQSIGTFSSNKPFNASGNIMSLLYGDNFKNKTSLSGKNYAFKNLFNFTSIVNASNLILPATTLAQYCYSNMFNGCTSLISAPALPATTLDQYCYYNMFYNCTSLTSAPALPATTLAKGCYVYMFDSCTSLTKAPALPATTLAENCYIDMFRYCTSLTSAPALPATTLAKWCYSGMFSHCTSLTSAPVLQARTLVEGCYQQMFYDCTNLNYIKCLATYIYATDCTAIWVADVASSGTFIKDQTTLDWPRGASGVPNGWRLLSV